MPKIGLRTIKTSLAVMLTMAFHLILYIISPEIAERWFSPFFAGIAAVYSLQRESSKSFSQARIRSIGSIFGGTFGMILVIIYESFLMSIILSEFGYTIHLTILYSITSIFIVLLIYLMVMFKQNDLVFVAALTYLSVMISQRNNLPVVFFAMNRIGSTIIGVMIALLINQFHFHRYRNKDILFVSALDQCLLNNEKKLTPYSTYTLSTLIEDGLNFTISTTRTPASLTKIFKEITLPLEMMIMNGAATYDMKNEKYLDIIPIPKHAQQTINQYFKSIDRNIFTYAIVDQSLSIYHTKFANEAEEKFYMDRKNDYFRNHIKGKVEGHEDIVYYILIDKKDKIESYISELSQIEIMQNVTYNVYPYDYFSDYYHLKINAAKSSKDHALQTFLKKHDKKFVVAFGSKSFDVELMKMSDFSFALSHAEDEVKEVCDIVLPSLSPDAIMKEMKKIYYAKNPKSYLTSKKETR